jgi:hypothetical protein
MPPDILCYPFPRAYTLQFVMAITETVNAARLPERHFSDAYRATPPLQQPYRADALPVGSTAQLSAPTPPSKSPSQRPDLSPSPLESRPRGMAHDLAGIGSWDSSAGPAPPPLSPARWLPHATAVSGPAPPDVGRLIAEIATAPSRSHMPVHDQSAAQASRLGRRFGNIKRRSLEKRDCSAYGEAAR